MKWVNHSLIGGSITAIFNPVYVPVAIIGSTAPDWLEFVLKSLGQKHIKHRKQTHYLALWLLVVIFSMLMFDFKSILFWFSINALIHVVCDSFTVTGVPIAWWSEQKMTLLGGRIRTGAPEEYIIGMFVLVLSIIIIWQTKSINDEFKPFFFEWGQYYQDGLIDAIEWKQNRFKIL